MEKNEKGFLTTAFEAIFPMLAKGLDKVGLDGNPDDGQFFGLRYDDMEDGPP